MAKGQGRSFKVDARALLSLGRESIKDHTTAVVELVKNSYDADAQNVDIEILEDDLIRISDDGAGMTSNDINTKWLRIGFSEKRQKKVSAKGRRETGEKGIGRLSADRLGALLELRSATGRGVVGIGVNWDDFDVDGAEVGSVEVLDLENPKPQLPRHGSHRSATGTEIRISKLRQAWSKGDVAALEVELSSLIPASSVSDFSIWLRHGDAAKYRRLDSGFEGVAELAFKGSFDERGRLSYRVTERPAEVDGTRRLVDKGIIRFDQLIPGKNFKIGPVKVELDYFRRAGVDIGNFTLSQLREYLNTYGGVRVYRDRVRVKPYGDPAHPEGDWLGLAARKVRNPAGAGRKEFRISPNQLVGAVYIGRDSNPGLSDSAAREGLVHGDSFATLKGAVFACVTLLESIYHKQFSDRKQDSAPSSRLPTVVEEMRANVTDIRKNLSRVGHLGNATGVTSRLLKESVQKVSNLATQISLAEREIEELASQNTVYRGLATVGISSAVFGHETESALLLAKASSSLALDAISQDEPDISDCEEELRKAVKAIDKVAVWGQFALARVKKDKRKRATVDVSKLVVRLLKETKPLFSASSISLEQHIQPGLELKCFAMDIEALTLNLLTNAYHAAGKSKRDRRVLVKLIGKGRSPNRGIELSVYDSGAGIARQYIDRIWTPLFSTKVDDQGRPIGTGLGLAIVKSIATDLKATMAVEGKGELGGATFAFLIPLGG